MSAVNRHTTRERIPLQQDVVNDDAIASMGRELDALHQEVVSDLGQSDLDYMRKIMRWQKILAIFGRVFLVLGFGISAWAWLIGGVLLGLAKILENMEIGHNVMHGQFNWTGDERLHSDHYEWDNVIPAPHWKHTHNFEHHTYTNVNGMDRDIGYGLLRMSDDQRWVAYLHPFQVALSFLLMVFFQAFVAVHYLKLDLWAFGRLSEDEIKRLKAQRGLIARKFLKHHFKDYILFPLLAFPFFWYVFTGNLLANLIRNVWAYLIIFCGHFPNDVHMFHKSIVDNENRAQWYVRQIKGSANIQGGAWFHILSGNLSHQIEHHLFPDMPSNRYREIAPKVREICNRYGVPYHTGSLFEQVSSVYKRIWRLSRRPAPKPAY